MRKWVAMAGRAHKERGGRSWPALFAGASATGAGRDRYIVGSYARRNDCGSNSLRVNIQKYMMHTYVNRYNRTKD